MTPKPAENPIPILQKHKENFLNELKSQNYSKNTITAYSQEIDYFIEFFRGFQDDMEIIDINRPFIQQSLIFREENSKTGKIATNTKKMYLKALYQFFVYLTDAMNGIKDFTTLFSKIKIKAETRQKEYLNEVEIKRLLNYINVKKNKRMSFITCRNILLIKILLYTGMRASEVINIKLSDITTYEQDKNIIQIRIIGKGNKEGFCYIDHLKISEELEDTLLFRKRLNITSEYLFTTKTGRQMTRQEAFLATANILKKAGINKKGLHLFRHTLGFHLAQKGVRIEDIQEILRHSNINTTRIYVQRREADKINGIKKIDY
ncbi:tyrosine-type recombinase/integrase [Calditerrivibrio nitroreducens]|uniref:Integrase family protein n=1 Tax=Calditerrivibrio nitroreducens (strain DSM 19672 / NBRC 101217 / Yu37-1) TaxID=768670 RepID=E4TKA6_CALNY|nr:tyrosine-type recombinase/integrase [Calditerrivibrio nitroreducens]ADR19978.1 integrase family protein [Calditerrivibrio nitroreducens DSM 19672]